MSAAAKIRTASQAAEIVSIKAWEKVRRRPARHAADVPSDPEAITREWLSAAVVDLESLDSLDETNTSSRTERRVPQ